MKWPQIITVILGVIAVAIAVRLRPDPPPAASIVPPKAAPTVVTGRILPPSFDQPGVACRLIGLLRAYVAVPDEIELEPSGAAPELRVTSLPILIVLENETYRPLRAADVGWLGKLLCTVRVARVPERGAEVEVYQADVPMPARGDWLSAERRSVSVEWPLGEDGGHVPAGQYKVTVRLALPDEPAVEIYTRLL